MNGGGGFVISPELRNVDALDAVDGLDGLVKLAEIKDLREVDRIEGEQALNGILHLFPDFIGGIIAFHIDFRRDIDLHIIDVLNFDECRDGALVFKIGQQVGLKHVADMPAALRCDEEGHGVPVRPLGADLADAGEFQRERLVVVLRYGALQRTKNIRRVPDGVFYGFPLRSARGRGGVRDLRPGQGELGGIHNGGMAPKAPSPKMIMA